MFVPTTARTSLLSTRGCDPLEASSRIVLRWIDESDAMIADSDHTPESRLEVENLIKYFES